MLVLICSQTVVIDVRIKGNCTVMAVGVDDERVEYRVVCEAIASSRLTCGVDITSPHEVDQ